MKKQLQKKTYAFIVTAMLCSTIAHAQLVFTDVIPDSTMESKGARPPGSTKNYNLDLDNNGDTDFIITAYFSGSRYPEGPSTGRVTVSPLNGNAAADTLVNFGNLSIPFQLNAVIDSNLLVHQYWITSENRILKSGTFYYFSGGEVHGFWDNESDYYLGLRLVQSGQTHYGWVRLRVDVTSLHSSVTIRDYAYNSIPNQPILAGQTMTTGIIENSFASSINLFPNPADNHLTIDLGANNSKVQVTIADITGKVIYTTLATDTQKVEVNTSDFAEGIYAVLIQAADFIGTKKLVVVK